ncbi:MAG: gephyrin-like molybdotransferase Glp [Anaerolineales bacterium]
MAEFLQLCNIEDAWGKWLPAMADTFPIPRVETVVAADALGRVLAADVIAAEPLPPFRRSTVDGYAVKAADTFGAQPSLPAYLEIVGEVAMGARADVQIGSNQAAVVHTGGMLPDGADAVVMLEDTQHAQPQEVEIMRSVAEGENVLQAGEDVAAGDSALPAGTQLRAPDIGGLMALGVMQVEVRERPRVALISTGDEVVSPDQSLEPGQVRDVNSGLLATLIADAGGESVAAGIVVDNADALLGAARESSQSSDVLVISAGSSVSARDITAGVIATLGAPGVLVHGIAIKPGKPTILGVCDGMPIIGLPGNPVSAYVAARLFLVPLLSRMLGKSADRPQPFVSASFSTRLASRAGREDYVPVRLVSTNSGWQAEPVYGRSNLIFTLGRADGWVRIAPESTGLEQGDRVEVVLLR